MKKFLPVTALLLCALLLLPLVHLKPQKAVLASATVTPIAPTKTFKVLITEENKTQEIPVSDYLFGVISAEMPALYESEALKAQAVCAYTFALWRQKQNADKEYDITDNFKTDQCYISREAAYDKWGDNATKYAEKIEQAIKDTESLALTFEDEIILSVYHSVSNGFTEKASNVWGKDYPYLQSVESVGDKLAKNYISTKTVKIDELKTIFAHNGEIKANPFTDFKKTAAGTVASVKFCGKEYKGSEIRSLLSLQSATFEADFEGDAVTFTVYGYGHGVGLSQNGANYLAQQGKTYTEILKHYYKGCAIAKIE